MSDRRLFPPLAGAISFLCLSNGLLFGLASWLVLARPLVNVDYLLALVLICFGWRRVGTLLLLVFLASDVLMLVGQVFPLMRLEDLAYVLGFVSSASLTHQLWLFSAILLCVGLLAGMFVVARRCERMSALALLNLALCVYAVEGLRSDTGQRFYRPQQTLVSSQTVNWLDSRADSFLELFEQDAGAPFKGPVRGASQPWLKAPDVLPEKLLLVVMESWGVTNDPRIQQALLSPLRQLAPQMQQGTLPFVGITLGGEMRELCGLAPSHYALKDVSTGFEHCLPRLLAAQGYRTRSMHAASGTMYDRRFWYPRVGFQEDTFFESRTWPRRCYSFPGGCDLDLLDEVETFFAQPGKRFLYWMTLNSHPPYDARDLREVDFDCAAHGALAGEAESCRNLQLQAQFLSGLARLLAREDMRGVEVIMIGDHPPVILDQREKRDVFAAGSVPWVRFRMP